MKILHFILGKANPDRPNGVNYVIHGLCKYLSLEGNQVKVIGVSKGNEKKYEIIKREHFDVDVYDKFFGECFDSLKKEAVKADIVHLHSVWQHYNIVFAKYLKSINKPYVVTIHSGLTEDRIKQSNYRIKQLYHILFQKKIFDNANGLHAITREEISDISKYTNNNNIFFVPNGIDLDYYTLENKIYDNEERKIKIGYLGRFGQEKNIKNLIIAISTLPNEYKEKIKCQLIGPIDKETKILIQLVSDLKLTAYIEFTGPLYNEEKYKKLNSLDFYVHPAYSDVVSIAVMEAMASGLPCLITRTSQVAYYYNSNSFIMVEPLFFEIKRGLIEMIDNRKNWDKMSESSLRLIKNELNWKSVSIQLLKQYENIIQLNNK